MFFRFNLKACTMKTHKIILTLFLITTSSITLGTMQPPVNPQHTSLENQGINILKMNFDQFLLKHNPAPANDAPAEDVATYAKRIIPDFIANHVSRKREFWRIVLAGNNTIARQISKNLEAFVATQQKELTKKINAHLLKNFPQKKKKRRKSSVEEKLQKDIKLAIEGSFLNLSSDEIYRIGVDCLLNKSN